jgi:hypothetical protein
MKQLQQAVTESFNKIIESGVIEKAIEQKLTRTIDDILDVELRSYSTFGKEVSEHVKKALQVDFTFLGLSSYNDIILKLIRRQVDGQIGNILATQVEAQMKDLLAPAPAEITLSKLIADFIEFSKPDTCSCDGPERISLHVEKSSYGGHLISFDEEPGKASYQCDYQLGVTNPEGKIFSLHLQQRDTRKTIFVGPIYGFERSLFQMHTAGTKLIVDGNEDDIDTHYPRYD